MNTPKTDAMREGIDKRSQNLGFPVPQDLNDFTDLSRTLETQVQELREALEWLNNEFKGLPHSLGYTYTHTNKVDAILEKTK